MAPDSLTTDDFGNAYQVSSFTFIVQCLQTVLSQTMFDVCSFQSKNRLFKFN